MSRIPNLAIIGGCGSSGTTLLANLLNKHPDVISGPELNFFNHREILDLSLLKSRSQELYADRCPVDGYHDLSGFLRYRSYFDISLSQFDNWVENSKDPVALIENLRDHIRAFSGKSYFIEKTPTNVYNFNGLSEIIPPLNLIHVIRDGRDVTFSLMKRGWSIFQAGSRWLYDTISGLAARGSNGYLEIRYEDLVREPFSTLKLIFDHLSLPFNETIYQKIITSPNGTWWEKNLITRAWGQTPKDPISSASIGKYKAHWNPRTLSTLYRLSLTDSCRSKLMSPANSFVDLLSILEYEDSAGFSQTNTDLSFKLRARYLEIQDYLRRIPKSLRKSRRFPPILTHIATK